MKFIVAIASYVIAFLAISAYAQEGKLFYIAPTISWSTIVVLNDIHYIVYYNDVLFPIGGQADGGEGKLT